MIAGSHFGISQGAVLALIEDDEKVGNEAEMELKTAVWRT